MLVCVSGRVKHVKQGGTADFSVPAFFAGIFLCNPLKTHIESNNKGRKVMNKYRDFQGRPTPLYHCQRLSSMLGRTGAILVNLSGRGDKNLDYVVEHYGYGDNFIENLRVNE